MTRAARLLNLLEALRQCRSAISGRLLADELGISLRTLYRNVATLRAEGAAIDGDAGVGYRLRPGFMLPPMMFGEIELEALALGARWVTLHGDAELARAARSAIARICATLPDETRIGLETNGLMVPRRCAAVIDETWLPELRGAIRREHRVELHYRDGDGQVTRRVVWPFMMGFFDDSRTVAAWCELRSAYRHFRADRIITLHDLGERYGRRRHTLIREWADQSAIELEGYPF